MKTATRALMGLFVAAAVARAANPAATEAGTLTLQTTPEAATVLINRAVRGTTPFSGTLPAGEHLVTIELNNHRTEHRRVVIAPGLRETLSIDLEPLTGLLLVQSTPPGAEVTVNGLDHGRTPALITTLPLGVHRVTLSQPGYRSKELEAILKDRVPRMIQVDLTSDSATLNLDATVPGAEVLVNGVVRGSTPCTVARIPAGETVIEIRMPGYQTFTQITKLAEGETQTLHARLAEQPATLRIVSIPDRARVYLNDEFRGETPLTLDALAPGDHRVRVELAGYDPNARTLTLERGGSRTEEFRLASNTGRLLVTTEPDAVALLVDGVERGRTAMGTEGQASATLTVDGLPTGNRILKFVRQGYHEKEQTITIQRGQTETLHVRLERRFIPDYEVTTATGTYRGVFDSKTDEAIRIEIRPGVISTYLLKDVRNHRPLPTAP